MSLTTLGGETVGNNKHGKLHFSILHGCTFWGKIIFHFSKMKICLKRNHQLALKMELKSINRAFPL